MKFDFEAGIYRMIKGSPSSANIICFQKEIIHTETFDASMGTYPKLQREIPFRLLEHAKEVAMQRFTERSWSDCKWHSEFRNWYSGYWHDDPHWNDSDVTEVFRYWHEGFEKCFYVKLSWDLDTLERSEDSSDMSNNNQSGGQSE